VDSAVTSKTLDRDSSPSVLWKAFDVLGAFSQSRRSLTLSEISRGSGLPKSTVHRILTMLLEVKAVERVGPRYRMGLTIFAMGTCSAEVALRDAALPYLERLRRATGQTVHLAVLDSADVVYIEKLVSASSPPTPAIVGGRLPAHATGIGKALLAFSPDGARLPGKLDGMLPARTTATMTRPAALRQCLREVREKGVATDRGEAASGLACVAAPVIINSRPVAAISLAFPTTAGSGQQFINPLREAAAAIARAAGTSAKVPLAGT
jgi:DNA-binding IclR family transcriptional regulator